MEKGGIVKPIIKNIEDTVGAVPPIEYDALRLTQVTQIKLLESAINATLNRPIKVVSIERDYHIEGGILVSYMEDGETI
jgi:hypothetical protein